MLRQKTATTHSFSRFLKWREPHAVIARKLHEIYEQKPNHECESSMVRAHRLAKPTNALDEHGEPLCPILWEPVSIAMRAIFVHWNSQGMPLSTIYNRCAILQWREKAQRDPHTRTVIQTLFDHGGSVIYPAGRNGEVETLSNLVTKRRRFQNSHRVGFSPQEIKARDKYCDKIDRIFGKDLDVVTD